MIPLGRFSYTKLPQGLIVASDLFKAKIVEIFGHLAEVIIYIDNILLFTKTKIWQFSMYIAGIRTDTEK